MNLLSKNTAYIFAALLATQSCLNSEKPIQPSRRDVTQAVYASGKVYPVNYYRANSSVGGYIQEIFVQVGDTVRAGQALFSIKNELSDFNISVANNNLQLAKANIDENSALMKAAQQEIAATKSKYQLDSANYIRYKNLIEQQAATPVAFDQARTLFETSKQMYRKAVETYRSTRQKLKTDIANAEQVYLAQKTGKQDFTIKSALDGRVYDIAGKVGEIVGPQVVVMEIGRSGAYEVELAIDETDINFIREGQDVVYSSEAFQGRFFKGKITKVYPKISLVNKSVKALATLDLPADVRFYAGSTIEANVVYGQKKGVLVLPKAYVHNDSIRVEKEGEKKFVKIKTGLNDVEFVEVVEGVSEKDNIYKP